MWDGNEVWLLVAGGATFAAFPEWYATLFSGYYLALLVILVALIVRVMAIEYRNKHDDPAWKRRWDAAILVSSALPAVLWGVAFANIVGGSPLNAEGAYAGDFFDLLRPYTLLGGLTTLALFSLHGAHFLALRTEGPVRERANALASRLWLPTVVIVAAFAVWTLAEAEVVRPLAVAAAAVVALALVAVVAMHRAGREGWAFGLTAVAITGAVVMLFATLYPNVMVSLGARAGPHDRGRRIDAPHAAGHDGRRAGHDPDRAHLPELDVLGVPRARLRRRAGRRPDAAGPARPGDEDAVRRGGTSVWRTIPALRRQAALAAVLGAGVAAAIAVQAIFLGTAIAAGVDGRGWSAAAWGFGAAIAFRAALSWVSEVSGRRAGGAAMADLRARLVASTIATGGADRGGRRAGELATVAVEGGAAVERWAGRALPQGALAATVPVAALAVIAVRDPLSAVLLAPTLPLLIVFLVLAGSDARRVADERLGAMSLLGAHLLDVMRGLPVLRSFGRAGVQREQLAIAGDAYRRTTVHTLRSAFVSSFALEFVAMLGTALVAVVAGVRLVHGEMAFEDALVVLLLAPELYTPLRRAGVEYHAAADARATLARLLEAAGDAPRVPPGTKSGAVADPRGHALVLDAVTVSAPGTERRILDRLSLEIAPGEVTALLGPSGAGKSTVLHVLLGLQPVASGAVRCGGRELAAMDPEAWRSQIAWMPQRPALLPGTLAENLRIADGSAGDERLWAALAEAGLRDWAAGLPGGLDARLGEGGVAVSAGERRRLALARSRCAIPRSSSSTSRRPTSTR